MQEIREMTVLGVQIRKSSSQASLSSDQHSPDCPNIRRGWCKSCTCDSCRNGAVTRMESGMVISRPCRCMTVAYSRHLLEMCGLDKLSERCTFDTYLPREEWQHGIKEKALEYAANWRRSSFFISGPTGCGKTHVCTAICNTAVQEGASLRYFRWVEDGTRLKGTVTDAAAYKRELDSLAGCDLLYIDDIFKTDCSGADLRLAYELINSRYIAGKPVVISSERSLPYIGGLKGKDGEAVAGRIFEMCGKGRFCLAVSGEGKNQRLL